MASNADYIGALDHGTTSTRFMLFNRAGDPVASHQLEHQQLYPKPGWVEHDPVEVWERSCRVIAEALRQVNAEPRDLAGVGITNQRETTVVWDPVTGKPWHNAVVWQDVRTAPFVKELASAGGTDRFRSTTGLPLATYFSGPKIRWILDNAPDVERAARDGRAVFGTMDSWLAWNLTGGAGRGIHITDCTNASRTMLMDIETLAWDDSMASTLGVPPAMLPSIRPSVALTPYGLTAGDGPFGGEVPLAGILGDQQAALFGQACFSPGSSKNTYGTGCFFLMNTGEQLVQSRFGLISTVAYKVEGEPTCYALEGSIAVAGALVQWLRDNLGMIERSADVELLAAQAEDSGGVYFVPAFSGLFAPHWRSDARGVITGLTGYARSAHIARAVLESTAFQTCDIVKAMEKDFGHPIEVLKVDGGMVANELLMQFQSDILDVPVVRPDVSETTALGAAYAAGLATGFWASREDLREHWKEGKRWSATMDEATRSRHLQYWEKAVDRSMGWEE